MKRWYVAGGSALALILLLVWAWREQPAPGPPERVLLSEVRRQVRPAPLPSELPAPSERDEPRDVECELGVPLGRARIELIEHDEQTLEPLGSVRVHHSEGWLTFEPRQRLGLGMLTLTGYAPTPLAWAEGACLAPVLPKPLPSGILAGRVEGPRVKDTLIAIRGCTSLGAQVDESGHFEVTVFPTDGERCEVSAAASFGTRMVDGPVEEVVVPIGGRAEVVLQLPPLPSVGWDLFPTDDGFRVAEVLRGSPAHRAGLDVGDRLLVIAGRQATSWEADELDDLPLPSRVTRQRGESVEEVELLP